VASTSERPRTGGTPDPGQDAGTPAAQSARHHNSFGLLRLILASLVIVQHSLALTLHEDRTYLGLWHPVSIGEIAVVGFFGLSGYLLQTSAVRHSPRRFLRLRFFRLFPGFWGTLLFGALLAAPLIAFGTGRPGDYRLLGWNSASTYLGLNSALVVLQHGIGGVLTTAPYPVAIDGSLWSLAPEFACYLILLLATITARRLGRPQPTVLIPLVVGAALALSFGVPVLGRSLGSALSVLGSVALGFFSGSLLAHLGWLRAPDPRRALLLVLATAAVILTGLWVPLGPPVLAAAIVATGTSLTRGWTTRVDAKADLSYGVYLYHFTVIQVLIALGATGLSVVAALAWLAPVTAVITAGLATVSWFAVEAPAQRYARRRKTAPAAAPAAAPAPASPPSAVTDPR
jgi:peptidoglycan/LPS O-acetylase OafA/YrhL